ncbi:MAG: inositol monophosphatase [Candidatus Micrarchaeota archaeon]|nr:inositol monophosphatase [Candidatus Micrarchaeota archaeon]
MKLFIESCLRDSARLIEKMRARGLKITAKKRNDMVTSADFASQALIEARIRKEFPGAHILSEEGDFKADLLADSLFVIDPIDGTHNFIQGIPIYGVSLAHFSGGKPTAGGTIIPRQNMLFYAEKGKPALLNGKKISVSKTAKLEDFFFLCDSRLHTIKDQGFLKAVVELERLSQHTRFTGCSVFELGAVACGMVDAGLYFKLKPYDFAAGALIVEQAGGKVTDFDGKRWSLSTKQFVFSNGRQHRQIVEFLQSNKES